MGIKVGQKYRWLGADGGFWLKGKIYEVMRLTGFYESPAGMSTEMLTVEAANPHSSILWELVTDVANPAKPKTFSTINEIYQALLDGETLYSSYHRCKVFLEDGKQYAIRDGKLEADKEEGGYSFVYLKHWERYIPPKPKKQVWQWRSFYSGKWQVDMGLMTEEEAKKELNDTRQMHAGPFEVEEV